ncbi:Clp protease [Frankia sp. CNm7]|uniref:Clp protease n=1 Tax=Frankia nepalensis TaxID=1836974 RepID=A0A937UNL4_9ACTN|nr:Clp protease N-terminal domain-containing protein [Frankia nepalensis]MBL7501802.1 Clp protease [Frankia nepalensis]MBL7513898.1 Clp protease [Frankia nepalensis]MBL7519679.1 Clp protease [Frankia nepalensis]MBL7626370.1 Clp protease [Frankia nepalensis]
MHDLFDDRTQRVIVLAQEEAMSLGHDQIGTEHLLLGLLHRRTGPVRSALGSLGVTLAGTRAAIETVVGRGTARTPTSRGKTRRGQVLPLTMRAKWILERARREAKAVGHDHVGPEHLLLSLLREDGGEASKVLDQVQVDREEARRRVLATLGVLPYPGPTVLDSVSGDLDSRIEALRAAKDEALDNRDFGLAVELRHAERTLLSRRERAGQSSRTA